MILLWCIRMLKLGFYVGKCYVGMAHKMKIYRKTYSWMANWSHILEAHSRQKQPFADVLQNSCSQKFLPNSQESTLFQSLFFNKVAGLRPAALLKTRLWYRYFRMNFAKCLRKPLLQNSSSGSFCRGVFMTLPNIYDGAFCEKSERVLVFNYFNKDNFFKICLIGS